MYHKTVHVLILVLFLIIDGRRTLYITQVQYEPNFTVHSPPTINIVKPSFGQQNHLIVMI